MRYVAIMMTSWEQWNRQNNYTIQKSSNRFKKFIIYLYKERSKMMKFHTNYLQQPVVLFLKNGKKFSMVDEKTNVETNFFSIVSIKGQMITLMKLLPCYVCLTKFNLKPTYQYV